jgi:hypothetical protein
MSLVCDICNKLYASNSSLWNHKNKIHANKTNKSDENDVIPTSLPDVIMSSSTKSKLCRYCNKSFYDRNNRNRHEKICKNKDISGSELNELRSTVNKLQQEINELKNINSIKQNKIVNNANQVNMNCGVVNNINIIPIGKENINELLTDEQIAEILKLNASDSLNKTLLLVCTAENLKECRNTYISSLEGKHCKVYDEIQDKFITKEKDEVLNDVITTHVSTVKSIVDTHGKQKKQERTKEYFDKLDVDEKLQKKKKMEFNAIIHDNKDNIKQIVNSINKKK